MQTVKTAEVSAALTMAKRVVPMGKGSLYRLEVEDRGILATDGSSVLEVRFSGSIPGMEPGDRALVEAADLAKVLKEWKPSEAFSAEVVEGKLRSRGVTLPEVEVELGRSGVPMAEGVRTYPPDRVVRVSRFASADQMRPVLEGIRFGADSLVATDSYRLAYDNGCRLEDGADGFTLSAEKVRHVAAAAGESMVLEVGTVEDPRFRSVSTVTKHGSRVTAYLRTIEGQYPDYLNIMPEGFTLSAEVEVEALEDQAAKCERWQADNRPAVLSVNGRVELGIEGEAGTVEPVPVSLEVERGAGADPDEVRIGVNPTFLKSAAGFFSAGNVELEAVGPLRPMVFRESDRGVLLMPIRLED